MTSILYAEDDADIRAMVTFKLELAGYQVRTVRDGAGAVDAVRAHPPDLVILDAKMPGMSGLEACRELRRDSGRPDLPILVLTAGAQEEDREQAYEAGATDYLVKPFSPGELLDRVTAALTKVRT